MRVQLGRTASSEKPIGRGYFGLFAFLKGVFLPQGYPDSVSEDYINYQFWDTVQAFCSTISGTLTTHAILKGVGVGNDAANALSATITWVSFFWFISNFGGCTECPLSFLV